MGCVRKSRPSWVVMLMFLNEGDMCGMAWHGMGLGLGLGLGLGDLVNSFMIVSYVE